ADDALPNIDPDVYVFSLSKKLRGHIGKFVGRSGRGKLWLELFEPRRPINSQPVSIGIILVDRAREPLDRGLIRCRARIVCSTERGVAYSQCSDDVNEDNQ